MLLLLLLLGALSPSANPLQVRDSIAAFVFAHCRSFLLSERSQLIAFRSLSPPLSLSFPPPPLSLPFALSLPPPAVVVRVRLCVFVPWQPLEIVNPRVGN